MTLPALREREVVSDSYCLNTHPDPSIASLEISCNSTHRHSIPRVTVMHSIISTHKAFTIALYIHIMSFLCISFIRKVRFDEASYSHNSTTQLNNQTYSSVQRITEGGVVLANQIPQF